jgi:hypothetical protein
MVRMTDAYVPEGIENPFVPQDSVRRNQLTPDVYDLHLSLSFLIR